MDLRRRHAGTAGIKPGVLHAVALKYGDGRRRPFEAARVHPRGSDHGLTRASTASEQAAVTPPVRFNGTGAAARAAARACSWWLRQERTPLSGNARTRP